MRIVREHGQSSFSVFTVDNPGVTGTSSRVEFMYVIEMKFTLRLACPSFFFKNKDSTSDRADKKENIIIPVFPGAFATSGANIVAILAQKFTIPIAVAANRVGKMFACEM